MKKNYLYVILFFAFLLRLGFLFCSENAVSDELEAYSRINIMLDWIFEGGGMPDLNFSTLYFYYLRFFNFFSESIMLLRLSTVLFGCLTVWVVFKFVSVAFSTTNAIFSSILVAALPLSVNLSTVTLPMTIYVFFVLLGVYYIHISLTMTTQVQKRHFFLAGIFFTIAAGFRFEGFILIFLVGMFLFFLKRKISFYFIFPALIFPLIYMFFSYTETNILLSAGTTSSEQVSVIMAQHKPAERVLIYFKTLSLMIRPEFTVLAVLGLFLASFSYRRLRFAAFLILGYNLIFIYKSYNGTLLSHLHRYFLLNAIWCIPFGVFFCEHIYGSLHKKKLKRILLTASVIFVSFIVVSSCYKMYLKTREVNIFPETKEMVTWMNENLERKKYVLLDRYEHPFVMVSLKTERRLLPPMPFSVDAISENDLRETADKYRPCYITCQYDEPDLLLKGLYSALHENEGEGSLLSELETVYRNSKWVIYLYE